MGKFFSFDILDNPCLRLSICKSTKILQVVKPDGKILKLKAPILVKDLLEKFEGFVVRSSKEEVALPPNFELKLGKVYHLSARKVLDHQAKKLEAQEPHKEEAKTNTGVVNRIKIVISKKQLEELLSKKTSIEEIILGNHKSGSVDLLTSNWKPSLISIPEENELIKNNK